MFLREITDASDFDSWFRNVAGRVLSNAEHAADEDGTVGVHKYDDHDNGGNEYEYAASNVEGAVMHNGGQLGEEYCRRQPDRRRQSDCVMSNQSFSGHTYSMDMSCPKSGNKGHITATWDTPESSHGTTHMELNANGRSMTMDSTMSSHFVSSDCGAVKPGTPVPVQ